MTMFQRKRIKEEINRHNLIVDASADSLLDRLKASRWTGLLLIAVALLTVRGTPRLVMACAALVSTTVSLWLLGVSLPRGGGRVATVFLVDASGLCRGTAAGDHECGREHSAGERSRSHR